MILSILGIIAGVAIVVWGADRLTEGASAIASRMGVSEIVIGLTVVALGTSMPEFSVSILSALKGASDIAIGNAMGSNIFNTLLIVGMAALVAPMTITKTTVKKDIPFALIASVLLMILCIDGRFSRIDAAVLIAMFLFYMYITLKDAKKETTPNDDGNDCRQHMKIWQASLWIIVGLACLVGGSNIFVSGAVFVAQSFNISNAVIGLTNVAGGTSMPELATSVVAAKKGNSGIAIGNVIGSNVFNILFILGTTGLICPMSIGDITQIDMTMLVGSMIMLWLFSFTKLNIERWEGAVLFAIFIAYMVYLLV